MAGGTMQADEVFCFFCSQKKGLFFFEKKNQKTFLTLDLR
jgi:hypothetical protein